MTAPKEEIEAAVRDLSKEEIVTWIMRLQAAHYTPHISREMVEAACRAADPALFLTDHETSHRAASPWSIETLRNKRRDSMRLALEAAAVSRPAPAVDSAVLEIAMDAISARLSGVPADRAAIVEECARELFTQEELDAVYGMTDEICDYVERCRSQLQLDGGIRAGVQEILRQKAIPLLYRRAQEARRSLAGETPGPSTLAPTKITRKFANERGVEIAITVQQMGDEIAIAIVGPESESTNLLTTVEGLELWKSLGSVLLPPCASTPRDPAPASAEGCGDVVADARRYRRLQILGCAPMGSPLLDKGLVLRFTGLDAFVDDDLRRHPSRGEAQPLAAAPASPPEQESQDVMNMLLLCGECGGKAPDESCAQYLRRLIDALIVAEQC